MRSKLVPFLAVAALAFAACGGEQAPEETPTAPESPAESPTEEPPAAAETASMSAQDNFFDPDTLSFAAGTELTVEVTNDGAVAHTFTIDELGVDTSTLGPGISESVTFTVPDAEVVYYCTIHGKSIMFGTLTPS